MLPTKANDSQQSQNSQTEYQTFLRRLNQGQAKWFEPDRLPILESNRITFYLKASTPLGPATHLRKERMAPILAAAIKYAWGEDAPGEATFVVGQVQGPEKRDKPAPQTRGDEAGHRIVDRRKPLHFRVDNKLYDDGHAARMKPAGLSVYLCLCRYADYDTNDCYPSYMTIAKKCGISRPTAIKHIQRLATLVYLEIEHNFNNEGEFTTNTFYILELPCLNESCSK